MSLSYDTHRFSKIFGDSQKSHLIPGKSFSIFAVEFFLLRMFRRISHVFDEFANLSEFPFATIQWAHKFFILMVHHIVVDYVYRIFTLNFVAFCTLVGGGSFHNVSFDAGIIFAISVEFFLKFQFLHLRSLRWFLQIGIWWALLGFKRNYIPSGTPYFIIL